MEVNNIIKLAFSDCEMPEFKELKAEDYVRFGTDNLYPTTLTRLYNKSAKHAAIINGKVSYIFGNGLKAVQETPASKIFIKKYDEVFKKCIADIETYGGFYLQVIPNIIGSSFTLFHTPFEKIRCNKPQTKFQFKNDWKDRGEKPIFLPAFDPKLRSSSLFAFKQYKQGSGVYALPDWWAAINFIESDIEVSKHTLTNAKTGFSGSKFIIFRNGKPTPEGRREVTKQFRNEYGGSTGEKIIIAFTEATEQPPVIEDLGTSDLTKEDFTQVDNLITSNIFAAHSVTHPLLFGIQQAGKLGSGNELRTAYDIFKNTYVTGKQKQIENIVNYFATILNVGTEFILTPVDPIGLDFSDQLLLQAAPRSWLLEKLGIDAKVYTDAPIGIKPEVPGQVTPTPTTIAPSEQMQVNENIKNLTAKQHQQLLRIIRQYSKGQITRATAAVLLKTGLMLTDADINEILGKEEAFAAISFKGSSHQVKELLFEAATMNDNDYTDAFKDDESVAMVFLAFGEDRNNYTSVFTKKASFKETEEKELTDAAAIDSGAGIDKVKKVLPKFEVRYSYEKRPEADGPELLETSRPFCVKMCKANKYFTRQNIQAISGLLGYDVFLRAGGFWNNDGTIEYHCRHGFFSHVVIKKKP